MFKYFSYGSTKYINPAHVTHIEMGNTAAWVYLVGKEVSIEMDVDVALQLIDYLGVKNV